MTDALTAADRKRVQGVLTTCGRCRLKLDRLKAAGYPVDGQLDELERTETAARQILAIDTPPDEDA